MYYSSATCAVLVLSTCLTAWAQDGPGPRPAQVHTWPNWMGSNHDGISTETGWSHDWPADGLPVVWTSELGTGFSSFSVVDGLAYSMGHRKGRETVWCLNADTGKVVWSHSYSAELNPNLYEGGPGSTPTVHRDLVISLSVDGRLIGFDRKTGDIRWEVNLQDDLDVGMHEWGFNSSPYILGEQLLLECGRVASYDWKTGKKQWQSSRHLAGYGSVRSFQFDGETLLATLDCEGLRISRAVDGSEVAFRSWRSPFRTNSTTPLIVKDRVFISSGYNVGSGLFQLTSDGLTELYSHRNLRTHFNNSILYKGHLYGFDGNSNLGRVVRLTCMDFETGEVKWKQAGLGCGSLMIADGRLLILSDRGDLVLADASPGGFNEVSRSRFLTGRCWTMPVLVNGRVYGRNADGRAVCCLLPKRTR